MKFNFYNLDFCYACIKENHAMPGMGSFWKSAKDMSYKKMLFYFNLNLVLWLNPYLKLVLKQLSG